MQAMMKNRDSAPDILSDRIGVLLIPGFTLLSLACVIEPLRIANRYLAQKYDWSLVSFDGEAVRDLNGLAISADETLEGVDDIGTLFILAGLDPIRHADAVAGPLRRLARRGVKLAGVGSGAALLAAAGLLDGRRATIHWENVALLSEACRDVRVKEVLFTVDDKIATSPGNVAALDLLVSSLEARHGRTLAVIVAEHCVQTRIRSSEEPQRADIPARFGVHHPKIAAALRLMEAEIEGPAPIARVARRIDLSTRQLLRLFKTHLDMSPTKALSWMRLERARRMLLQSDLPITEIAVACGFRSSSHFSRAYRDAFGAPPGAARAASPKANLAQFAGLVKAELAAAEGAGKL